LNLKIPGPSGTIIVNGSFTPSDNCDRDFSKLSESFGMKEELPQLKELIDTNVFPEIPKTLPEMTFDSTATHGSIRCIQ
jgi:hypothetical protein